jgi:hypothetical protein
MLTTILGVKSILTRYQMLKDFMPEADLEALMGTDAQTGRPP